MFGRMMSEPLGKLHFWITFAGAYCIFMPMHFIGIAGAIRRYADATGVQYLAQFQPVHKFMTVAAFITAAGQLIFLWNFFWSLKHGEKASDNPWHATTLEWSTATPPPHDNFGGHYPSVYRGPYEFSVPGATEDYIPQHLAPQEVARSK
jgi:cytochrome c oxidase subunit I